MPEGSRFDGVARHFYTNFIDLAPLSYLEKLLIFSWRNACHVIKMFYLNAGCVKLRCRRLNESLTTKFDIDSLIDNVKLIQNFSGTEILDWVIRCKNR